MKSNDVVWNKEFEQALLNFLDEWFEKRLLKLVLEYGEGDNTNSHFQGDLK